MTSVMMPAWALTVLAGIIIGLIGLLWRDLIKRIDALASKVDSHITEDVRAHERVTALETTSASHSAAIKDNADRLHRFMVETRLGADAHYKWITEQFSSLHRWLTEKVLEAWKK